MSQTPTVDFVFFDAGGGHRAAASALQSILQQEGCEWNIRLMDLQDVLEDLDIFKKSIGFRSEDIYNTILEKGWTLGSSKLLPVMHSIIRAYHPAQVRLLTKHWEGHRPDMVVSLVPNFDRSMWQALQKIDSSIPFVTILTDMADFPPHFWIERQKQVFICGTDHAVAQVRQLSPQSDAHRVSGMVLHPKFYQLPEVDIAAERMKLGLDPNKPTGLVLFGGMGSEKMLEIFRRIDNSTLDVQLIMICGKNKSLQRTLCERESRIPKFVEGFTLEVPRYMQLADFFIGKPGPGSISEAVHMGLPVIVEKNAWTLPQERFNADWVVDQNVGEVLIGFSAVVPALERMLNQDQLKRLRANARAIQNRAIFEIPHILKQVLNGHGGGKP